jgi:hypothetical protein
VTGCNPIGLGRSGERVLKTPWIGLAGIVARPGLQHVALAAVEPGEDEDLVADLDPVQGLNQIGLEDDPRLGRPLVSLLRSVRPIGERRFDPADRPDLDLIHTRVPNYR